MLSRQVFLCVNLLTIPYLAVACNYMCAYPAHFSSLIPSSLPQFRDTFFLLLLYSDTTPLGTTGVHGGYSRGTAEVRPAGVKHAQKSCSWIFDTPQGNIYIDC